MDELFDEELPVPIIEVPVDIDGGLGVGNDVHVGGAGKGSRATRRGGADNGSRAKCIGDWCTDPCRFLAAITAGHPPKSFKETRKHEGWREVIRADIKALEDQSTWELQPPPPNKKVLGNKWVYTEKYDEQGKWQRLKAILVIFGNHQRKSAHIHQAERLDPNQNRVALWLYNIVELLPMCVILSMLTTSYMKHVIVVSKRLTFSKEFPNVSLAISQMLLLIRLTICDKSGTLKITMLYGLGQLILGCTATDIKLILQQLCLLSKIASSGKVFHQWSLVNYPIRGDTISVTSGVVSRMEILSYVHGWTELLGDKRLIYLAVTRPDLAYFVHILSQFMQVPKVAHWKAALRVVRYLKKNPGQGVLFRSESDLRLEGWCDSDWASCPITRRSLSGWFVLLRYSHAGRLRISLQFLVHLQRQNIDL
ncbi:uncharacterized protein LOC109134691 [Beta vulgaris subsp. vulgaris]|uniref:uncharacterized protein LOC109134691 n=1 Tax=Beta vulgaris subsp. vulgaris TaxID=3555 RepID=UPI002036965F|nr:uncharacterized protein LOC109134691 [Beta vulgaris subsp. vulgaris]